MIKSTHILKLKKIPHLALSHLFLAFCLILLVLSLVFRFRTDLEIQLLFIAVLGFVGFSLIHHHFDKTLTLETVIDYVLIAALVIIILMGSII